ncbi:MAG: N-acetylglucosamine-6-phosphate deacetylase [Clostridia bacterium]|nr:N-acetylglucosamine-6-phosphate deacetylase [Clostridia bacterium]
MITKIENVKVFNTEKRAFEKGSLYFENGNITSAVLSPDAIIDGKGGYLIPGLIDVHTHGRCGIDVMSASAEELSRLSLEYAKTGVTTLYPTIMTAPVENLKKAVREIKKAKTYADFAGIHIEGPYISAKKPGCHNVGDIRKPDYKELEQFFTEILPLRTHLTVAPEEDTDGVIEKLTERFAKCGGTIGIGHSNATYAECVDALNHGARSFTHTFNAMTAIGHREPGVAGAALATDAYAELICDGIHVCPAVISIAYHAKRAQGDKFVLITDSIPPAGLPNGEYNMNGIEFTLKDGKAVMENGTIVGSALDLYTAVNNLVAFAGISFEEALIAATKAPAEMVGIYDRRGSLTVGKRADMVLLDKNKNIRHVFVAGNKIV